MSGVTQLLNAIEAGEPKAADQLLPLVYEELRKLAVVRMANEKAGQTLQPTALVHEAWLKITGDGNEQFANRRHFFKAAATAMQQILIDNARRKQRLKHGANQAGDELHESRIAMTVPSEELLAVKEGIRVTSQHLTIDFSIAATCRCGEPPCARRLPKRLTAWPTAA
jgi:RNA polymerase sigma factor (TIGR02999 family)